MKQRICQQCDHHWWPRKPGKPRRCPNPRCTNPYYWDSPRTLRPHPDAVAEGDEATLAGREESC